MGAVGKFFSFSEPQFSSHKMGLTIATLEYDVLIISGFLWFFLSRLQTGGNRSNPDRPCSICPSAVAVGQELEGRCVSQGNSTNGREIYLSIYIYLSTIYICGGEREEDFKEELVHTIMGAGKSKICRVGWQAGDPGMS